MKLFRQQQTVKTARRATLLAAFTLLCACGGGGGGGQTETPVTPEPPGAVSAPLVSTRGTLALEQYDRESGRSAQISRSTLYTLIPEGAAP